MAQVDSENSTAVPGDSGHPQATESGLDAPLYVPTDVTPEELFQAIGRLRTEARNEIHRLIQFLDTTDDYASRELEDQVDDNPCDDVELEPSLCGVEVAAKNMPADQFGDDREGEHDGREPETDDEPSPRQRCGL
jgi:hypothetical protein